MTKMTTYEITYMADPGDGIESKTTFECESDDMSEALIIWWDEGNDYFVIKCEIIGHPLKD